MTEVSLVCHRATPAPWLDGIVVQAVSDRLGGIRLVYTLSGDLAWLRLPPPATPDRVDGLWQHTCCEAFVKGVDAPAYREYNLSPSGTWQAYDFQAYRRGGRPARAQPPHITCQLADRRLTLTASLTRLDLRFGHRLRVAPSAVIEDRSGQLSYWAMTHAALQPDFHHPDAYALELDLT
ncbi:MAG: DOMON-like domain-containing protein [Thiobacillaceae bacterium]